MSDAISLIVRLDVRDDGVASAIGFPRALCQPECRELRARLTEYAIMALVRTFTVESDLGVEAALEHLQAKIHNVLMHVTVKYHNPNGSAPDSRVGDDE